MFNKNKKTNKKDKIKMKKFYVQSDSIAEEDKEDDEDTTTSPEYPILTITETPDTIIKSSSTTDTDNCNCKPSPSSGSLQSNGGMSARKPSVYFPGIFSARIKSTRRSSSDHVFHSKSPNLSHSPSTKSISASYSHKGGEQAHHFWVKNRRVGDDALSAALSAIYAKLLIVLGVAMPVTEVLTSRISPYVYQGFYIYLYLTSILYVIFVYVNHYQTRVDFSLIKTYQDKTEDYSVRKRTPHFGSFYLRVGAISFGIGTMVYSGLEFGQYFEITDNPLCDNIFVALTPACRMALAILQMQFIFLNTTELDMAKHKVISRFGLMHMIATNICEWFYVLVEETKHEIHHFAHMKATAELLVSSSSILSTSTTTESFLDFSLDTLSSTNSTETHTGINSNITIAHLEKGNVECERTNIMGSLVQNASPFLFPCTIEYSLICAVVLYEMWKKIKSIPDIERFRKSSQKKDNRIAHHFTVDCARAHQGMFVGILIVVLSIICMIMYFVLHDKPNYEQMAISEVTFCEILMYTVTMMAVIGAVIKMRDLKYYPKSNDLHTSSVKMDCTLLVLAQTGVYVYGMFSIIGNYFSIEDSITGGIEGLIAELLCLIQTSVQTLFILNASWRRCRGAKQQRIKPGREIVTFLLVANMSIWSINTLIKGHAGFRPSHLNLYGIWAWTVITHVSMPLAIYYRFHSTICLFEIWKSAYKLQK